MIENGYGDQFMQILFMFLQCYQKYSRTQYIPYLQGLPNFVNAYSCSGLFALEAPLPFNCNLLYLFIPERSALFSCLEWHFNTCLGRQASKLCLRSLGKPQKRVSSVAGQETAITYFFS